MKVISLFVLALFILSACAPQSEVDDATKKIAELQAKTAAAQAETEKIKALKLKIFNCKLKSMKNHPSQFPLHFDHH